jgi:hypothetical protein
MFSQQITFGECDKMDYTAQIVVGVFTVAIITVFAVMIGRSAKKHENQVKAKKKRKYQR